VKILWHTNPEVPEYIRKAVESRKASGAGIRVAVILDRGDATDVEVNQVLREFEEREFGWGFKPA
jgi:hypothetical protein